MVTVRFERTTSCVSDRCYYNQLSYVTIFFFVGVEEFESSPTEPESVMLPLHHTPITQGTSTIFVFSAPKLLVTSHEQIRPCDGIRTHGFSLVVGAPFRWATQSFVGMKGLEPSTPCSQSRCSSQLNYIPIKFVAGRGIGPLSVPYDGFCVILL